MNFATRALLPLLSISLNDEGGDGGSGGGADGAGAGESSSGDGKGSGSSGGEGDAQAEGEKKPDADAKGGAGDDAAKKAAAEQLGALTKSYEGFKLKMPEPLKLDEATASSFTKAAIEAGVKPEQFQKLADVFAGSELGRLKTIAEGLKKEIAEQDRLVRADKELAGEDGKQLDATAALARKTMQKFATPKLRELLRTTRLETHPEMLRLMARVGRGLAEDKTDDVRESGGKKELSAKEKLKARYSNSPELFNTDS
jgi:hypothetical protein